MVVTLETLNGALEYLETSLVDWHVERGLAAEFRGRSDFIAITGRDRESQLGFPGKGAMITVSGFGPWGHQQEVFEFGTTAEGYVADIITTRM